MLQGLTAMHVRHTTSDQFREASPPALRKAQHPLVMVHPTTHRRAIYVNTMFTNRIVELDPDESDRLLERLFLLMSQPELCLRAPIDDRRSGALGSTWLVHGRKPFDVNQRRHLQQITTLVADPAAPWAAHAGSDQSQCTGLRAYFLGTSGNGGEVTVRFRQVVEVARPERPEPGVDQVGDSSSGPRQPVQAVLGHAP
jgi:Taurine catabolism dioxygenase TauD, TfdA family